MKKMVMMLSILVLAGCADDRLKVIHNGDRVSDLERRVLLLEQVQAVQAQDILDNANAILQEKQDRIAALSALENALQLFVQGELADYYTKAEVDAMLADAVDALELKDADLQAQIDAIVPVINNYYTNNFNPNITISIPLIIGSINLTVNHTTQQVADLSALLLRVSNLEGDVMNQSIAIQQLEADMVSVKSRLAALEAAQANAISFVQLCSSSNEMGMKQGSKLYAVLFATSGGGGLIELANGDYYTTTNITSACRFNVSNGNVSTVSTGHDISGQYTLTQLQQAVVALQNSNSGGGSGISGACVIQKTQDYGDGKHYSFALNNSAGLIGDYKIVLDLNNNSATLTNDNSGTAFTKNASQYSYTPINNATSMLIYSNGNSSSVIQTAKVVKVSDTTKQLTCTVNNAL